MLFPSFFLFFIFFCFTVRANNIAVTPLFIGMQTQLEVIVNQKEDGTVAMGVWY